MGNIDRWQHLGHTLGECFYCGSASATYVHIPKNASSFIKSCLFSTQDWFHSEKLIHNDLFIVALRDPIERWCSGIAQFASSEVNQHLTMNELVEQITWDDHTELQTYFLQGVDLNKAVFFRVDRNLRANIGRWLNERGYNINVDELPDLNTSESNGIQALKQRFQSLMGTVDGMSPIKLKLLKHYADDYDLIARVKFYD